VKPLFAANDLKPQKTMLLRALVLLPRRPARRPRRTARALPRRRRGPDRVDGRDDPARCHC